MSLCQLLLLVLQKAPQLELTFRSILGTLAEVEEVSFYGEKPGLESSEHDFDFQNALSRRMVFPTCQAN